MKRLRLGRIARGQQRRKEIKRLHRRVIREVKGRRPAY